MLALLPRFIPALSILLADLGNPSTAALARALDVTPRTVERWQAAGKAPRAAELALYWLTRWGRSALDTRLFNDMQMHAGMAACMKRENGALREQLAQAEAQSVDEAANAGAFAPGQRQPLRLRN